MAIVAKVENDDILSGEQLRTVALGQRLPLGHSGTAGDIARAVTYLVREDFITGTILVVDGGDTLR